MYLSNVQMGEQQFENLETKHATEVSNGFDYTQQTYSCASVLAFIMIVFEAQSFALSNIVIWERVLE